MIQFGHWYYSALYRWREKFCFRNRKMNFKSNRDLRKILVLKFANSPYRDSSLALRDDATLFFFFFSSPLVALSRIFRRATGTILYAETSRFRVRNDVTGRHPIIVGRGRVFKKPFRATAGKSFTGPRDRQKESEAPQFALAVTRNYILYARLA